MAGYALFLSGSSDCDIASRRYSDAEVVRVPLHARRVIKKLPQLTTKIWADPSVDGFHNVFEKPQVRSWLMSAGPSGGNNEWIEYARTLNQSEKLANPAMLTTPDKAWLRDNVASWMNACLALAPTWISVPQFPQSSRISRYNKINIELANATQKWKSQSTFTGKLILPVIFSHQGQLAGKTHWKPRLSHAHKCYTASGASGMWIVDATLDDWRGSGTHPKRFASLVELQEYASEILPSNGFTIVGPYWGMNLVLWARGTATFPSFGVGGGYQYYIPGQPLASGKDRLPIGPLRRLVVMNPQLRIWLKDAISIVPSSEPSHKTFKFLDENWEKLSVEKKSKEAVAISYKKWYDSIASVEPQGRSLALYQDLSKAYVLGRTLNKLPESESPAREAGQVAQQLMLHCL